MLRWLSSPLIRARPRGGPGAFYHRSPHKASLRYATAGLPKLGGPGSKPLWTTGRALLFSAAVSSLAYTYGINGVSQIADQQHVKQKQPSYGKAEDLRQVRDSTKEIIGYSSCK